MSETEKTGRTPSDALVEILTAPRILLAGVILFVFVFFMVLFSAEPGSTVEVLGILKYQKSKAAMSLPKSPVDDSATYELPKNREIKVTQIQGVPILDGTLSILSDHLIGGGMIVGPSVKKIRVAARGIDGQSDGLTRPYKDNETVLFLPDTYIEIEFRGQFFAMTTRPSHDRGLVISLSKVPRATLDLILVKDLPIPTSSE
jgi:hypothetical protein